MTNDQLTMRLALRLARRGYGTTSPNPMVGAVLVKGGKIIGRGWHRRAGGPHAEIEALHDARRRGHNPKGATLYVTLEPCCTFGRTPPCTEAIVAAGIRRVVAGTIDPNPAHAGKGLRILKRAGLQVAHGLLEAEAKALNESFNHWIVHRTPFVTVKAAMSLDGKIATASGESKWITGAAARNWGMKLRQGADAILAGVNTVIADEPSLTFRPVAGTNSKRAEKRLYRIILDSQARTPLSAKVVGDEFAANTIVVVTKGAPRARVAALSRQVQVWTAPAKEGRIELGWLLKKLGQEQITSLLVEGGGEVNAAFLLGGLAQRIAFFYAPKIIGGRNAIKAVAGQGLTGPSDWLRLQEASWTKLGDDLLLSARLSSGGHG